MKENITIQKVQSGNRELIDLISGWYLKEWAIPVEKTYRRLAELPNDEVLLQLVLMKDNVPAATGGLYNLQGLHEVHPELKIFRPWVALLYTQEDNRNQGLGNKLLQKIEDISQEMGFREIYLHTFTAERLYLRHKWEPIDRVPYKGHITVVMKKEL